MKYHSSKFFCWTIHKLLQMIMGRVKHAKNTQLL